MPKKKRRARRKSSQKVQETLKYEIAGLLLIAFSIIGLIPLGVGNYFVYVFQFLLGRWYKLGFLMVIVYAGFLMIKRTRPTYFNRRLLGFYIIVASLLLFDHIASFESRGSVNPSIISNTWDIYLKEKGQEFPADLGSGMIGAVLLAVSYFLFEALGTKILSLVLLIIGFMLLTNISIGDICGKLLFSVLGFLKEQWQAFLQDIRDWQSGRREKRSQSNQGKKAKTSEDENEGSVVILDHNQNEPTHPVITDFSDKVANEENDDPTHSIVNEGPETEGESDVYSGPPMNFSEVENEDYQLPPISLLKRPKKTDQSNEYRLIHENAAKLERTFQSFGVKAKVTQVHLGPAVTKYEVHPDIGVKVSKIVSLSDDLALALAAKDIRMEAPIPGKSAIGIEVPNSEVAMVSLREVLESKNNDRPDSKLLIGLGRDITGEAVLAELNKMPHLLVAGATGSGKSVCINGIITSILMRAKPHEVKLMMIDPKMVELNVYNGIPHLLAPVVTNAKKASQALKKVVGEMERRYELFSHSGTRNIEGYNEHVRRHNSETGDKQPLLPYIVVIVDELADLMMVASSDVEDSITRLAQMARAAGIHLIIATQRPSVDVITGVIKANIPSRIAFAVSSQTDSRTILDMGGAEKLLGRGDMLFLPVGASKPIRVQGAFLSDEEVEEVVNFVISQQKAQYQEDMIPDDLPETSSEVEDELYDEAVQLVAEMQTASVSMLQRRFRIGYTRAARLIDEMEARGVVGPYEGSKPRAVLIPKPSEQQTS
ncbi:FtsK/SpoIIIE family DNA translocase [Bacillus smithii]|jgi:S-DNA-T family DNA segregation ATPase FtsK/SpoIIIE|uniref:FtsK/SpoIIIE family DNA translocase n=1 Tax=Bacillus smithii TaxID=1479 RepID=UPI002E1FF297|nr:DNA translocase FtsK [Bacillus smithii]MED4928026.1 DNA translocase FtsK [Bacillus smithii]